MADERVPELVADLEDQLTSCLQREAHIDQSRAVMTARKIARFITDNWGGQLIYFPKNLGGKLTERDLNIWKEFNGKNHVALARKYDLTVQQIYSIMRSVGERERAKNQPDLFP